MPLGRGPARRGARQPRLHRIVSPVDGVVVSRTVVGRPDGRRELPDADAVPGRHRPDQDAGERERQRVRHRRRGASGRTASFTVDAYPGAPFRGPRHAGAQRAGDGAERRHLRRGDRASTTRDLRLKPGMTANVTHHDGDARRRRARADGGAALPAAGRARRARAPIAAAPPGGRARRSGCSATTASRIRCRSTTGIATSASREITGGLARGRRAWSPACMRAAQADAAPPRSPFMPSVRGRRGR